ncbi:MAG: HNH endonuclease [Mycobacteriaceae bacterium]|nr:HNH endonuclease [Mycobacteriaceae bacterium]
MEVWRRPGSRPTRPSRGRSSTRSARVRPGGGANRPAVHCDIDHTIPRTDGGRTHASNLKCLCRVHQLLAKEHLIGGAILNLLTQK